MLHVDRHQSLAREHTCKTPVSSRSPLSFTNTRSDRDSRMRSKGSWMPDDGSMKQIEEKVESPSAAILPSSRAIYSNSAARLPFD